MSYITSKEAAAKWKISEPMVRRYCRDGRIADAVRKGKTWFLPSDTKKPAKKEPEIKELPPMVKRLMKEKTKRIYHGLYDYIQINFCYSSNRMASNRLMRQQVEDIYKTGKVKVGYEPIKVDDLIEAYNHLAAVNHVIETATTPLTQAYIKRLHALLGYGTVTERKGTYRPGEYRRGPAAANGTKFTPPKNISSQMGALITEYEALDKVEHLQILDFHVRLERIHPFEDANGRVGRLLMFKESLRHKQLPFVLDDKRRPQYLKGLREWDFDKSTLLSTCHEAQQRFSAQLDLQQLHQYAEAYKPYMEV